MRDLAVCPRALHVAPEMAPLVKLGGLGDVVGSLPGALRREGADCRVLLPAYPGCWTGSGIWDCPAAGCPETCTWP